MKRARVVRVAQSRVRAVPSGRTTRRDARIPEKNDGKKVDEAEWLKSAAASEKEIFQKQTQFFEELERRAKV